jgi:hypothetical protein
MFAAIDKNINIFHKGFGVSQPGGLEDPTYLGFRLVFDFDPSYRNLETFETDDALFARKAGLESAQQYLRSIGMPNRADALEEFRLMLQYINKNAPWFFQSVEGVADLWRIDPEEFNNMRAKGRTLKFNCLESIDLRITALADLYRKATFDAKYMRDLLPENLKWFTLKLQVAEMRAFQRIAAAARQERIATAVANRNQNVSSVSGESVLNTVSLQFEDVPNLISIMEFNLSHCHFDFSESFPTDNTISMGGDMNMAKQSFKIHVHKIIEKNEYVPLKLKLSDKVKGGGDSDSKITNVQGGRFGSDPNIPKDAVSDLGQAFTPRPFNQVSSAIANLQLSLQREIERLGPDLVGRGVDAVNQEVNQFLLGNAYQGIQNMSLGEILAEFMSRDDRNRLQLSTYDAYPGVPGPDSTTRLMTDRQDIYPNTPGSDQQAPPLNGNLNAYSNNTTPPTPGSGAQNVNESGG